MSGELARIDVQDQRMSLPEMKEQVRILGELLSHIMIKDTHYGTIPGTQKPTLYKPGSEKILSTFRIAATPGEVTDLSTEDEVHYRVRVDGTAQATGILLGSGIGECSSDEEKYKWRKPVCDAEFDETAIDRRREVWKRGQNNSTYKAKQVRMNPKDVANTILKMAKKRAQIDMTLTVTAASDVFDQDLEDLPPEVREGVVGEKKETVKAPQEKKPEDGGKTDDEKRGEIIDLCAVYAAAKSITVAVAMKEFTVFTGSDGTEKYQEDPKKLSGKWLNSTLGRARELAKPFMAKETAQG